MKNNRLSQLFDLYHKGEASKEETDELMNLLEDLPDEEVSNILAERWNNMEADKVLFADDIREKIALKLQPAEAVGSPVVRSIRGLRSPAFLRMVAAAVIIFLVSISIFLMKQGSKSNEITEHKKPFTNDIKPGSEKAILTLADGKQIVLDSVSNGDIAQQGGIKVIKIDGQLTYDQQNDSREILYNTITTPKGGQYQLELADGSKVWLNAASSLRFPTSFPGITRDVELTGEGYFEVAHNTKQPFHVKVNQVDIEVLGTKFNINSYSDEPSIKTTLLQGKVKVNNGNNTVYLKPGTQAVLKEGENIKIISDIDMDEVVAWKNGYFLFNSADLATIMRQASRWYNVTITYRGNVTETFSGNLTRYENISKLLKILEATGKVSFEINDKEIIVKPNINQ
jgi:ferric-dicitrate binding protein FerR (iron transport regulator)